MTYYLNMLTAIQFKGLIDLAKAPGTTSDVLQRQLNSYGKDPRNTDLPAVRLDMFLSDINDYADRTNPESTPLKGMTPDDWFNVVKLLTPLKQNKKITDKFTADQKRKLNIHASLERYPTVARILNA